jgi:hypothetical protein
MRPVLSATALGVALLGASLALPAHASPGGGGCELAGNAVFTNGPNATSHNFTYTFTGALTNCQDSLSTGITSGSIGTLVPATGSGTCANGTTAGVALITWSDKTRSVISYTTNSAGAEVVLQGTVIKSYTVTKKVGKKTRKKTYTSTNTYYAVGDGALADLAFQADPTQCAGSGVTTAPITGFAGIGRES